jgi:hypothetical protein
VKVTLSQRSQKLMLSYLKMAQVRLPDFENGHPIVDATAVIAWLNDDMAKPAYSSSKKRTEALECMTAELRAFLLADLKSALPGVDAKEESEKEKPKSKAKKIAKYVFLSLAGTLVVASEGFDSITAMMGMLSVPSLVTFLVGFSFSIFSVAVLHGLELYQIAKNLGVRVKDASKMLEACNSQLDEIKSIRRKIASVPLTSMSSSELAEREKILAMLAKRCSEVSQTSKYFVKALNGKGMKVVKYLVTGLAGFLFFGSGFFAGQSVAVFVLNMFYGAVASTFWPVILFSVLVGLASLAIFWIVENEGVSQLISKWFRLDREKIDRVCDKEKLEQEENKLQVLKENVQGIAHLKCELQESPKNRRRESMSSDVVLLGPSRASTLEVGSNSNHFFSVPSSPRVFAADNSDPLEDISGLFI